jgi:phenylpyruvate tautomerase PptA (4-oxalocrotonate tautomerase family)
VPLVTVSLEGGRTQDQKCEVADALYEALQVGIQIPESDHFLAVQADEPMTEARRSGC